MNRALVKRTQAILSAVNTANSKKDQMELLAANF